MLHAPFRHSIYDGIEPFAVLRYSVFHPRRIAVTFSSFNQMIVNHLPEPFCQHLLADAVNVCLNGLEARTAVKNGGKDLNHPLAPQYVHCVVDRHHFTAKLLCILCHHLANDFVNVFHYFV